MLLRHAAATDVGRVRDHNEDTYVIDAGDERATRGALFVVCDGMGGHARGEVASDVAAKAIVAHYDANDAHDPVAALREAFAAANREVVKEGNGEMGTTAVAAVVRHNVAVIGNIGDCRAYLIRDGEPRQITRDHSFVAEQVAAGILTAEQAKESSYRHIVTRAIGHREEIDVDVYQEPLAAGDVLVLCSDGLHGQVDPSEIALAVSKVPLQKACNRLVALANKRGGPDNITLVAVKVERLGEETAVITPAENADPAAVLSAATAAMVAPATSRLSTATNGTSTAKQTGVVRVAPPLARPEQRASRGMMVWLMTLMMVAAVGFGGYSLWRIQPATGPTSPFAVPTLTPLGAETETADAETPAPLADATVEPDETATAEPNETATPGSFTPRLGRTPRPTRTPTPEAPAN